ncbi:hypothetical protein ACQJBY_026967 [Aegilops geniculata]
MSYVSYSSHVYLFVTNVVNLKRSYSLSPEQDEATTKHISDEQSSTHEGKPDQEDAHSKDATLPGLNLIFDGVELHPFDIGACLQARQPLWLIAEASTVSSTLI